MARPGCRRAGLAREEPGLRRRALGDCKWARKAPPLLALPVRAVCLRADPRNSRLPSETQPAIGPRSPIMHLTELPPALRNSETSMVAGVTAGARGKA